MSLLETIESVTKDVLDKVIPLLITVNGVTVTVIPTSVDEFRDVYGVDAGTSVAGAFVAQALIVSDGFTPASPFSAGLMEGNTMFCMDPLVKVGCTVEVARQDGKTRRFKITDVESLGTTIEQVRRFNISALGD